MDILLCLAVGFLSIILWITINIILENSLSRKTDEISKIKMISRKPHYRDHNKQYRKSTETTISFWYRDKIDPVTEEIMRYNIRKKKEKENDCR